MGRTSEITYEAVAAICTDLAIDGKRPTFALIKERLGGSYEVLKRHLDRWLEESASSARYALPNQLANDLGLWFQQAKGQAQAEADHWLASEKALLQAKEQQWQALLDNMKIEVATANEQCSQMGHDLSIKTLQASHAVERAAAITEELAKVGERLVDKESQCAGLIEQLSQRTQELQSERQRHSHELELAQERTRGTEKALLMRHHAEVELQKERTKSLEERLEDQKLRTRAFEQNANLLRAEIAALKSKES
jgi:hypothetical protein